MSGNAATDRWFRSADWDEASQAEFTARLARARPHNRYQYRRIKALALLEARDRVRQAAGRALLEENLALPDLPPHERTLALGTLARNDLVGGRLSSAMRSLRGALAIGGPDASGTTGEEEIELAEVLLTRGGAGDIREAKALLDRRASDLPVFVRSRYRLAVAQVQASLLQADVSAAADWASTALALAATQDSGLRHHRELGLVDADEAQLAWLREVANPPAVE
jgi:hypothetical protein